MTINKLHWFLRARKRAATLVSILALVVALASVFLATHSICAADRAEGRESYVLSHLGGIAPPGTCCRPRRSPLAWRAGSAPQAMTPSAH